MRSINRLIRRIVCLVIVGMSASVYATELVGDPDLSGTTKAPDTGWGVVERINVALAKNGPRPG